MDKLFECATTYKQLLSTQYNMIVGRKGKTINISIKFNDTEFVHLLGLHKLEDNEFIRSAARTKVFSAVLNKKITFNEVKKSKYFSLINNRFEPFSNIENLFDSNELIFRYNEKQNAFSLIKADFLLATPFKETDIYIFISKNDESTNYFCRSFFPKETKDYTFGQTKYALLYKEKVNLTTGEIEVQYDRLKK